MEKVLLVVVIVIQLFIYLKIKKMDKTIDEALASVTDNETVGGSVVVLLTAIKKRLDDVLSGVSLPPAVQAKVNAIFESSERDKQKLTDAIVANTPNEEPTEPPVEPQP